MKIEVIVKFREAYRPTPRSRKDRFRDGKQPGIVEVKEVKYPHWSLQLLALSMSRYIQHTRMWSIDSTTGSFGLPPWRSIEEVTRL